MFTGDIFDPFAKVKGCLKVDLNQVFTDNWIFYLHRKWSYFFSLIALLIIFSYPVMIEQPIVCHGPDVKDIPKAFLDEWCWVSGTYIVPEHIGGTVGKDVVHSGVGPDDDSKGTKRLYNNQYIFYPMIFLVQLATFVCAKYTWILLEGGRLKNLLSELTTAIVDNETMRKRINLVTDYMTTSPATFHNTYAYRYIFCEIFNAFNVIFQFMAIDRILHEEFLEYGWNAIAYLSSLSKPPKIRPAVVDPFTKLFPKLTICHFTKFGPSGNPIPLEALCILPLNNIADKIFLAWWFWLVFLGCVTILGLLYRALLLFSPCARYAVLRMKTKYSGSRAADLRYFVKNCTYGDWFVLSLMHKNMDTWVFSKLFGELIIKMRDVRNKRL